MIFTSDNAGPAAPRIMAAMNDVNEGYRASYGADAEMDAVRTMIRDLFEAPQAEVFLVATGTAANALSLASICPPWGAIYCHSIAHIEEDECGAPEFYTGGAKLVHVTGPDARMTPQTLKDTLARGTQKDVHQVQRGALSITNATENGAVYTPDDVAALTALAKAHNLPCHMDGARFANAIVATGASAAQMTWKAGIDVLSFGGTKNGCLGVEAVVLFNPEAAWEFQLRRKRGGHLFSKHRYLSAQMKAYLEDNLWLDLARQANDRAALLSAGIKKAGYVLAHPTDANMIFARWSRAKHKAMWDAGAAYYLWPHTASPDGDPNEDITCRLVCNWATTEEEINTFLAAMTSSP